MVLLEDHNFSYITTPAEIVFSFLYISVVLLEDHNFSYIYVILHYTILFMTVSLKDEITLIEKPMYKSKIFGLEVSRSCRDKIAKESSYLPKSDVGLTAHRAA